MTTTAALKSVPKDGSEIDNAERPTRGLYPPWPVLLLVMFWALEVLAIQHWTTFPDATLSLSGALKDAARRLVLNLAACAFFVCLLRRWPLRIMFGLGLIGSNLLIVYATYFGTPLSYPVIANQWREGLAVSDHGFSLVSGKVATVGLIAFSIKLLLANWVQQTRSDQSQCRRWGVGAACFYIVVAAVFAGYYKPIRRINLGTPEYVYGYTVAWTAEMLLYDNASLLEEAVVKAQQKSELLARIEQPIDFTRHVAVVQVESLDFDAVDARVDGQPVMPFLTRLKTKSMVYAVKPFHFTGSSEADFSMLTTAAPNGRVNPFQIQGFVYDNALPWLAKQRGYKVIALHGNTGEFFHRRKAYRQMGFDNLYFTEELAPLKVTGKWDEELFDFSAQLLNRSTVPCFHFLITITSHGPFNRLPPGRNELFSEPANSQQHYLNSMRYVDRALSRYIEQLPAETTVVIYGDHESNVHGYCQSITRPNRVPWFIYRKDQDLSARQRSTESGLALSGDLSQLDMVCYFRDSLTKSSSNDHQPANLRIALESSQNQPDLK